MRRGRLQHRIHEAVGTVAAHPVPVRLRFCCAANAEVFIFGVLRVKSSRGRPTRRGANGVQRKPRM